MIDYITVPISVLSVTALCDKVTMSRQEGTHNSSKTSKVEAVGATGQGPEARVAEEGGAGGAGGFDDVEEISGEVVTKEVEGSEG
ncbi:uncharacterized protein BcabD6B2_05540 [Babesia caballi]|uniref:Uncharacterized protein n=1 Tax=Babesia caballi TaxID=5871 RepID=A0AAV4LMC9_BABCB|nr:hypothetical protein BcabD6B2_05540 [Babesia caballi]